MGGQKKEYIPFEEFVKNSGVKESTIKRRYKEIPGIEKTDDGFRVLSGTRYPCSLKRFKLKNSNEKRYALLQKISEYKYVTHKDLRVEYLQFMDMLRDFLSAGLIQPNNLCNEYGANAYDCTMLGDELLQGRKETNIKRMANLIAEASGIFTGAVISKVSS